MARREQLLTLADAARELGLSRQRLALIAKEGRIGSQIAGRYWVFTPQEIAAYKPLVKASKGGRPKDTANPTMENRAPALAAF